MPVADVSLRVHLVETNPRFAELYDEHCRLDDELSELVNGPYMSEEQQFREQELKKRKLHLKDQMQFIVREHERASNGTH